MNLTRDNQRADAIQAARSPQAARPSTFAQPAGNEAARDALGAARDADAVDITAYVEGDIRLAMGEAGSRVAEALGGPEVTSSVDLQSLVADVLAQAGERPIGVLRVVSHAREGELVLGHDTIDHTSVADAIPQLQQLSGRFAPRGRVEIHGCNFAAGDAGQHMLYVLSSVWGVPVTGSAQMQSPLIPGLEGSETTALQDADGFPTTTHHDAWSAPILDGYADVYDRGLQTADAIWEWVFGEDAAQNQTVSPAD